MKYEPPVLVDMKGPGLCGEFVSCIAGSKAAKGSCYENNKCNTGTGAEQCANGQQACGCDACCGIGNFFTTQNAWACYDCTCDTYGSVAYYACTSGPINYTGTCNAGLYAVTGKCTVGESATAGTFEQCATGP
jgi:hypothetical protein